MNKVQLYGELGDTFGSNFELDVLSPAEAYRAMSAQLNGFREIMLEGNYVAVREMRDGRFIIEEDMLWMGMQGSTIHFIPMMDGAAGKTKGVAKTVLGVALIGAALFVPVLGQFGVAFAGGVIANSTIALGAGLALALGGAALLIAPTPKMDTGEDREDKSFLFSGDVNAAQQNMAVPITYGFDRVRPIPIATQVKTDEYRIGVGETYSNNYNGVGGNSLGGEQYYEHDRLSPVNANIT